MWLSIVIPMIGAAIALQYLFRQSQKSALKIASDIYVLCNSKVYKTIGAIVSLLAGVFLLILVLVSIGEKQDLYALIGMIIGFGGLGIFLLIDSRCRIILSPEKIESFTPWRGHIVIQWAEIESITFWEPLYLFVLYSTSGKKIYVNSMMIGIQSLFEHVSRYVDPTVPDSTFVKHARFMESTKRIR